MVRTAGRVVAAVALTLLLAGCSHPIAEATVARAPDTSYPIDGIRTGGGEATLVASYLGGDCDAYAHLDAREEADRVTVEVKAQVVGTVCHASGHPRTVSARLATPLSARTVWAGGTPIGVFDGDRLQRPAELPAGFDRLSEVGGGEPQFQVPTSSTTGVPRETSRWTFTYGTTPDPHATVCEASRGPVVVEEIPVDTQDFDSGAVDRGERRVGGATATVFRAGASDAAADAWNLTWSACGGRVVVQSIGRCVGDRILDPDELVAVATSLRPMG